MKVVVYVEGPSDQAAMRALLRHLLEEKERQGVAIQFVHAGNGDAKKRLITEVPRRAANTLLNDPETVVVVVPDLYPRNKGFPHETVDQLMDGIRERFAHALHSKAVEEGVDRRFRTFCFKYDLEALLLACDRALAAHLGVPNLGMTWTIPVEDQDHERPPKRVIEDLFAQHGRRYRPTVDAPVILSGVDYQDVAAKCPQCFQPFAEFLKTIGAP